MRTLKYVGILFVSLLAWSFIIINTQGCDNQPELDPCERIAEFSHQWECTIPVSGEDALHLTLTMVYQAPCVYVWGIEILPIGGEEAIYLSAGKLLITDVKRADDAIILGIQSRRDQFWVENNASVDEIVHGLSVAVIQGDSLSIWGQILGKVNRRSVIR